MGCLHSQWSTSSPVWLYQESPCQSSEYGGRSTKDRHTVERQALLMELSSRMAMEKDIDSLLKLLVSSAASMLDCDQVMLYMRKGDGFACKYGHPASAVRTVAAEPLDRAVLALLESRENVGGVGPFRTEGSNYEVCRTLCRELRGRDGDIVGVLRATGSRHRRTSQARAVFGGARGFDAVDQGSLELLLAFAARQLRICELTRADAKSHALLSCLMAINSMRAQSDFQLKLVVRTILANVHAIVECDRCTLFIVDNFCNKLLGFFTVDGEQKKQLQTLHIPMQGIAELVARTGELQNVKHAWSDRRFSPQVDLQTGYRTETILCAPLKTSNGKTIAVLQCVNKHRHEHFDSDDERMLMAISEQLSDLLQRLVLDETYESFVALNKDIDADVKDMVFLDQLGVGVSSRSARRASNAPIIQVRKQLAHVGQADPKLLELMRRWNLKIWSDIDVNDTRFPCIFAVFDYFDLFAQFSISRDSLGTVLKTLQARYSSTAPYHNWAHAFGTFHAVLLLLDSAAFCGTLSDASVLALLLAALGHDVEHPGVTNAFLVNAEDSLALRYNDVAVLENHHSAVTCGILKNSEPYIFAACCPEERAHIRKLIVKSILGTDMSKHQDIIASMETSRLDLRKVRDDGVQLAKDSCVDIVVTLLHCADLSHPLMPWAIHKQISKHIIDEFSLQYMEEQRLGLPSLPFMGKNPNSLQAQAPTQDGFIQFVVTPLYAALNCFAGEDLLDPLLSNIGHNRAIWNSLANGADEPEVAPFEEPLMRSRKSRDSIQTETITP